MFFAADKLRLNKFKGRQCLLIVGLFLVSACALVRVPTKEEVPPSPEITRALERFEKAEHLFQEQAYSEALVIYQDYLRQYPKGPLADTALMKAGSVYMAMAKYAQARKAFQRLISKHRKSPFVEDARFSVMLTYYSEGDYGSAVRYGRSVIRFARTPHQKFRIHNLRGYTYCATKQFKDAVKSYMDAYQLASKKERTEILSKVKELISYLKEPELNSLLKAYRKRVPGGYLRLQLAKKYASEDRIEHATKVLSDFISLFPHHDQLETARALMEELKAISLLDRYSIGCILPLSGPYSTFGNRALTGIELALSQFNAQPHVNPIQLLIKDSKGDPNEATAAVKTLALTNGVTGIIGPMITSESAAIKAQALKVPIMTLTQKPNITELGDYVFRNFLTLSLQIRAIMDYAVEELGLKKFAILYPDEQYGISFMNRFWDELIRHGAEVVGIESYTPDQTDFSDVIKKLVGLYYPRPEEPTDEQMLTLETILQAPSHEQEAGDPFPEGQRRETGGQDQLPETDPEEPEPIIDFEAIFIPDSFEKVGLITPQLLYNDVADVLLLGTNLWHSHKLIEMARKYVQGAVVPDAFFVNSPSPEVQAFVKSFREVFERPPGFLEAQAYDAAWILFQTINQPQVWSRRTLKMALMEVEHFPGVTGLTSFDETGDAEKHVYLLKVAGGRFIQIMP
ncbi:MAG: penicillin-binding protein activator [Desulfobacterales bacterium]|nr:penicillin-binding protein activator [Desulfobacterales bacterium]